MQGIILNKIAIFNSSQR